MASANPPKTNTRSCRYTNFIMLISFVITQLLLDIVDTICAIHKLGYIHCDLHLSNLLVLRINGEWRAKVIDLGLCKKAPDNRYKSTPVVQFNPNSFTKNHFQFKHIAPEILLNHSSETLATDVFAVGNILRSVGRAKKILPIINLGRKCMANKPQARPKMEGVLKDMKNIVTRLANQQVRRFIHGGPTDLEISGWPETLYIISLSISFKMYHTKLIS